MLSSVGYSGAGGAAGHATSASVAGGTYSYSASYDTDLRLSSFSVTNTSSGATLFSSQRGYDAVGNVTAVGTTLAAGTDNQVFCYDDQHRLTWAGSAGTPNCGASLTPGSLTAANYTQTYTYDTLDRLQSGPLGSYNYGDSAHLHAVTSIGSPAIYTATYDAGGNMTCRAPSSSTTCSGTPTGAQLTYDNEGRLAGWQNTPSAPTTMDSFLYDGEGNRVEQQTTTNGSIITSTVYVAGGLEEITTSGASTTLTKYFGAAGLPTAERIGTNGPVSYLATDGQGTISETLDGSGNVTSAQLYTPYGTVRYSSGSSPTSLGYTGQRADSATGLDYYHARYYDPVTGQFISADTVQDGLNRYGYVGGNPATATDPSGHRLDPGSFGNDYQAWLQARQRIGITGGSYISPNVRTAANTKTGGSETVEQARKLAIRQNNMGGVNAKVNSGRSVPTLGTAVIYVEKWNFDSHRYEQVQVKDFGFIESSGGEGPIGHAEGNVMAQVLAWIEKFEVENVDNRSPLDKLFGGVFGIYKFTIDMVIAQGPCKNCRQASAFDGFVNDIREATRYSSGFTFNWDFLASDDSEEPIDPNAGPSSSVLKTFRSYTQPMANPEWLPRI